MKLRTIAGALVAGAASLTFIAGNAQAIAVTDVSYNGADADAAVLVLDDNANTNPSNINDLEGPFTGESWSYLDSTDDDSALFSGVTFQIDTFFNSTPEGGVDETSGGYIISWQDEAPTGDLPLNMDLVLAVKAGNDFGAYLFDEVEITVDPLYGTGTFEISWLNNGGNIPDLSHATIYGRLNPTDVPEPGILALFGLGLAGLGFQRKRSAQ